jgi:hypothetical protein
MHVQGFWLQRRTSRSTDTTTMGMLRDNVHSQVPLRFLLSLEAILNVVTAAAI